MFFRHSPIHAAALALASLLTTVAAHAQTFFNTTPIDIPARGAASPYPSTINVSNGPTSIQYVSVTLTNLQHSYVGDVNVLLVSPTGQKILLMANAGGGGDAVNSTLSFVPDGTAFLPASATILESGVYACSVYLTPGTFPAPAPAGPYLTSLASLINTDANGAWNLYVLDNADFDSGTVAGGWSVTFNRTPSLPLKQDLTYQGRIQSGGTPFNGDANLRFTLCNHPSQPVANSNVAPPISRSFTGITDGLITAELNFGNIIESNQSLWLNIEVEAPPGSGFVTLSPRQALTPAPIARVAQRAFAADIATTTTSPPVPPTILWTDIVSVPSNVRNAFSPWVAGPGGINYSAGRVGIGTPVPTYNLEVRSNTDTQIAIGGGPAGRTWTLQSSASDYFPVSQINNSFQIIDRTVGAARVLIDADGNVGIGTSTPAQRLTVSGNVLANNVAVPSSGRFKHNVLPINDALDKLLKLEGVSFDWNPDFAKDRPGREHDIGFVAEDVAKVFPEVVFYDAEGKVTGMDYSRLTAVAVAAIKQQQAKFAAELAKRDAENTDLKARLDRIERLLEADRK